VNRRFEDRGEVIVYAGRDWQVSRRFPLGHEVVLVVESEGGRLALVTRGDEVRSVQPAAAGLAELSDAVATILYGTTEHRDDPQAWR
jgi:hypothetical protein